MSIEARIDGRRQAELMLDLGLESDLVGDSAEAFWQAVVKRIPTQYLPRQPAKEVNPFNDVDSKQFGCRPMPYGKHAGARVDSVDIAYLSWLADNDDPFREGLKRYLRSERVKIETTLDHPLGDN